MKKKFNEGLQFNFLKIKFDIYTYVSKIRTSENNLENMYICTYKYIYL